MKKLTILLAAVLTAACATGYNPSYRYNEVQIVNLSGDTIRDVSVQVIDTPKALSCEEVLKFAMCHDRFPHRYYPQQGLQLSWTHPDGSRKSEQVNPNVPVTFPSAFAIRFVVEVREDGSLNPFFEQDEPSREGGGFYLN